MSEHVGQDNGTLRITIREAANHLGVTEAAIRKRIQRGSLDKEIGRDGRVYVYLDMSRDISQPEPQVHREARVCFNELIEELRDRVAFLERALERRSVEAERYQQIVAGLTQTNNQLISRLRELEPPPVQPALSQSASDNPQSPAEGAPGPPPAPAAGAGGRSEGAREPWWRRWFEG